MRYTRYFLAVSLMAVLSGPVLAEDAPLLAKDADEAGLKILAGMRVQANDNLFVSSSSPVSDVLTTGTLGLSMKTSYSRQRLALDAAVSDNEYQAHQDWNYIGTNLAGAWDWSSGTGFHGTASAGHVVSQNPVFVSAGSTQRNLNTTDKSLVALGYEFDGGWDINTGLVYASSKNENAVVGQTSYQSRGVYAGATYSFRSGSAMTLTVQSLSGSNIYDYAAQSTELKFSTTGKDTMTFAWRLLSWNQSYEQHPEYNFSGLGGGAMANWPITAKTSVTASAQREFYAYPTANSIYSIMDSVALLPAWEVSAKVTLRGQIRNGVITDQGDPGGGASGRVDNLQTRSVGLYWAWRENALVSLSAERMARTSNVSGSDFVVNLLTLEAMFTF
jgi:hypothetical protein